MKQAIPLALVAFAGCATDPAAVTDSWYGASYEEVARTWGQPLASSKDADGTEMHVWRSEGPPSSGSTFSIGFGSARIGGGGSVGVGTGVTVPVGPPPAPLVCERRLFFREGVVIDQDWSGDQRYCASFKHP